MRFIRKRRPPMDLGNALSILYSLNKLLGLAIYRVEADGSFRINKSNIVKGSVSFMLYSWSFTLSLRLFYEDIFRQSVTGVARMGLIMESIISFVILIAIYVICILLDKKRMVTWTTITDIDERLRTIGIHVTYERQASFTNKITFLTIGILFPLQWYLSVIQGYMYGPLGYAYGMQITAPLIITFAVVLQFQSVMFLLCERFELINKNLEHILKYRHGISCHKIKYLSEFNNYQAPYRKIRKEKDRRNFGEQIRIKRIEMTERNLQRSNQITPFGENVTERLTKLLGIFEELCEWGQNMKSVYSTPMLAGIALLFTTAIFKMYLGILKFQQLVHKWDFATVNTYFTVMSTQCIIHLSLLILLLLIESCTGKIKKSLLLIHNLILKERSREMRKRLLSYSLQLLHRNTELMICGMFALDLGFYFTSSSNAFYYMLMMFQF